MFLGARAGSIITSVLSLAPALPQTVTNGLSTYGTLNATPLDAFVNDALSPSGVPWGNLNAKSCNPETDAPFTGVTRVYEFTFERGYISPDGYQKHSLLINGQYPGPLIEANWGDTISVTVHNKIKSPDEGTSVHWHGFLQKATPWYDGVPSVSQCPIAPGASFTYTFRADMYGSTWYHSHYSAQYSAGLLGPMVIHGPENNRYDVDLGPVFLTDWYHTQYPELVAFVRSPGINVPFSDNNLINGKGNFNCSSLVNSTAPCTSNAGLSKFRFTAGKIHRLRLINAGTEGLQRFSIDNHEMTVIANDFVSIQPYSTKVVTLSPGQRSDVLVTANAGSSDAKFWMRSNISTICCNTNQPNALAVVYYDKADTNSKPTSIPWDIPDPGTCQNDPLADTIPLYSMTPSSHPATETLLVDATFDATGHLLWYMNQSSYIPNVDDPLLLLAEEGNISYPDNPQWNVYDFGERRSTRIVLINNTPAHHPMHIHGQNMYVLAEGTGSWDGTVVNPSNPQRRDTQQIGKCILAAGSRTDCISPAYLVIQLNADNPGVWPFHCHVAWHLSTGLYVNIMQRPLDINQREIPEVVAQTCKSWNEYVASRDYNPLDPGVSAA